MAIALNAFVNQTLSESDFDRSIFNRIGGPTTMRPQHAHKTPPAGNRQARRKASKLARRNVRRAAASAPTSSRSVDSKLAAALAHVRADRLDQAEPLLRSVLDSDPDMQLARNVLGQLLDKRDNSHEAYHHHKLAVTAEPENAEYWRHFGRCLGRLNQDDAAVVAYERAAAQRPDDAEFQTDLGKAYSAVSDFEAAVSAFDKAISLRPDWAIAHMGKGCQLQFLGDFPGARACFERALQLDPGLLEAHFQLIQMGHAPAGDEAVVASIKAALDTPELTPLRRSLGLFTLAKLNERQKDYDTAFEFYAAANDMLKTLWRFRREENSAFIDELIEGFSAETIERLRHAGSPSDLPVFIVGMPRSGTTLVEQIISGHTEAFGGGEVRKIVQLATALRGPWSEALRYPRDAAALAPKQLSEMAQIYLSHLEALAPRDAARVADKMPFNFLHLGLIAVLFPNAAIIHCCRDPMDTCLSCYFQCFNEPGTIRSTNDLEDLGFLYQQYRRIMDHWRAVLPTPILDVAYEDVVQDHEGVGRRILDFVGLDWEKSCLSFHESRHGVRTASMWQVRQPIYTSSLQRWRRYEKHLDPLKEALADLV